MKRPRVPSDHEARSLEQRDQLAKRDGKLPGKRPGAVTAHLVEQLFFTGPVVTTTLSFSSS